MSESRDLRKRLDEAITYGNFELARSLALGGLRQSQREGLLGEIEYFKGQIEILNGNHYEAIRHFDLAIQYNPRDGAAFNDRALCMVELGIIEEAFYYFDKGIEVEPDYATIYHNKGWLLNKIGRPREAIEYFKKALALEPERAVTYENLGNALAKLADYQGALSTYQKALDLLRSDYSEIREQIATEIEMLKMKLQYLS